MSAWILIADNDLANLERVSGILSSTGYAVHPCNTAESAWQFLSAPAARFELLIVEQMLAADDGVSLLARIKTSPDLVQRPVIVLSDTASPKPVDGGAPADTGLSLNKPCEAAPLLAMVHAALGEPCSESGQQPPRPHGNKALLRMQAGRFQLSTLQEASLLANFLARASLCPERCVLGLSELLINSVEHGNLGITYAEKSELRRADTWLAEVERRGILAENCNKRVSVNFFREKDRLTIRIRDEGQGFDWKKYLDFDPERAFDLNGRGIALARAGSFDSLTYEGGGNVVVATIFNKENETK